MNNMGVSIWHSQEEHLGISGGNSTPVSVKVERVNGLLNQGQAGAQMEIVPADRRGRRAMATRCSLWPLLFLSGVFDQGNLVHRK